LALSSRAFVFKPKDIEVEFVALEEVFVGKTLETLGFFSLVPIFWIVAFVGAQIVNPEH
jgi:hypothetical protein